MYNLYGEIDNIVQDTESQEPKELIKRYTAEDLYLGVKEMQDFISFCESKERELKIQKQLAQQKLDKVLERIKEEMINNDYKKIETGFGNFCIDKNPISVKIIDETKIPDNFKKVKTEVVVDKTAIKDYYKRSGYILEGVEIIDNATTLHLK